jgi:hypothetical protein
VLEDLPKSEANKYAEMLAFLISVSDDKNEGVPTRGRYILDNSYRKLEIKSQSFIHIKRVCWINCASDRAKPLYFRCLEFAQVGAYFEERPDYCLGPRKDGGRYRIRILG